MDYGMIGKREKAKRYAEERKRFLYNKFDLTFHGDNNNHHVSFENGVYKCDCEFFITHQRCAHTMAIEILEQDLESHGMSAALVCDKEFTVTGVNTIFKRNMVIIIITV